VPLKAAICIISVVVEVVYKYYTMLYRHGDVNDDDDDDDDDDDEE
jgi:hypothetical protein